MRIKGHSNAVAISLGIVALVIATTGTAVAVTATTTNIADPKTPTQIARVDSTGRLATLAAKTTINAAVNIFVSSSFAPVAVTSPTTANLGITSLNYDNAYNIRLANNDYDATLYKATVGSSHTCNDPDTAYTQIRRDVLRSGDGFSETFPSPLIVKPTGSKAFCLAVYIASTDNTFPSSSYAAGVSLGATVISGTYSGAGSGAAPAAHSGIPPKRQLHR
jgi:hypothetical protein